ncbi:hypothetical protein AgCh_000613 [Apium graveolens]
MSELMNLAAKFVSHLRMSECNSDEMRAPHSFCLKYGFRIPTTVKGLHDFYHDFGIVFGYTLCFEYVGDFDMEVCITDPYGFEIDYPSRAHHLQARVPSHVDVLDGGWTSVRHQGWGGKVTDSVRVWVLIPSNIEFVVNIGYELVGKYARSENGLSHLHGLHNLCNILRVSDLNCFHKLVFTYDGGHKFVITAIDTTHIKSLLGPASPQSGDVIAPYNGGTAFQFVIQQFQLRPHEHGVDVPVEFKNLSKRWLKTGYISAYVGNRCWLLQIRRHHDRKRCTINDSWLVFRRDLQLDVGDNIIFKWRDGSIRNFNVVVLKKADVMEA